MKGRPYADDACKDIRHKHHYPIASQWPSLSPACGGEGLFAEAVQFSSKIDREIESMKA